MFTLKQDLKAECGNIRLDQRGTIAYLRLHLQNYYLSCERCEQSSLVDPDDPKCDVILVTQFKTVAYEKMKRSAKPALSKELAKNELNVGTIRGPLYVKNTPRLGLAGLLERMRLMEDKDLKKDKMILLLEKEIKLHEEEIETHREEITKWKGNLTILKLSRQNY